MPWALSPYTQLPDGHVYLNVPKLPWAQYVQTRTHCFLFKNLPFLLYSSFQIMALLLIPVTGPLPALDFTWSLPATSNQSAYPANCVSKYALSLLLPSAPRLPSLFSLHCVSHSLLAPLPSIPVSCLGQPPPPSIWTLVICKTENLGGSSLPTDDKMQANILCMTYMLAPAPFPRLISSNSPQHILLQLQKNYSPNEPYSFMARCVCICCFLSKECPSSSSLMFSDSRL